MSTLHERLLAAIDSAACHECGAWGADALRAVVELHTPRPCNCKEARHVICDGCPGHAVVCVTLPYIAARLGVEIEETPK